MPDSQDLNSLERFRKRTAKIILEEHGHCEVPAGCGGVVLRWRNPFDAVPLTLSIYTPVPASCFLDAGEVRNARVDLAPGRHAFSAVLKNVDLSAGLILLAAVCTGTGAEHIPLSPVVESPLQVLTADDGSWKFAFAGPASDDWKSPAFDDRDWTSLVLAPAPQLDDHVAGAYACGDCLRLGAVCLGLPGPPLRTESPISWWERLRGRQALAGPTGDVWIRKVFDIPVPQRREP